jgi:hypothetical protein
MPQTVWSIETAVHSQISATAAITDIIGTSPVRAFPEIRFDGAARPCIVYELGNAVPFQVLSGTPTLVRSTVSIHCLADDKKTAVELARQVQLAFQNWSGSYLDGATVKITVQGSRVSSIVTDYQPPQDGATYGLFISTVEVTSLHTN